VAANGSDTNNGASESTPWLHAPGMPNCASTCAALSAGNGGIGIILRGGDTWHFGKSSASPYTGGTWDLYGWFSNAYAGTISNCVYEGAQTGCVYVGVDQTWYSGSSWARPLLTADNATVGSGFASTCAYQVSNPGGSFGTNALLNIPAFTIIDNFELTGLCVSASSTSVGNTYLNGWASSGNVATAIAFATNVYMHGWSATSAAGTGSNSHPVTILAGGGGVQQVFDHIVIDGSDSNPEIAAWGTFPTFTHMRDSIVRYIGQGVGSGCHDIHDNIFEHFYFTELDGHINAFECNHEAGSNQIGLNYVNTANVFYNNVMRHFDPSFGNGELVWFCPNTTPDYWFNNVIYDVLGSGVGQFWAIAGTSQYADCTATGGQYMFNNTFVDGSQVCHGGGSNVTGGQYLTVYNEHLINTPWDTSTGGCTGFGSSTNVAMSDAAATTQGYTTGSSGTVSKNTCANDSTVPCSPTASSNSTVGAGSNVQSYCTSLASYTSEKAIGSDAANACKYATTDGCSYNTTTHAMVCPAQTAVARPISGAWGAGAYQFSSLAPQAPQPPTALTVVVN
jgi:hypothetical protein